MKKNKVIKHPSSKPEREGGWHIKTKDGRTFDDLTIDEAVEIYHDCKDAEEKTVKFKKEDEREV